MVSLRRVISCALTASRRTASRGGRLVRNLLYEAEADDGKVRIIPRTIGSVIWHRPIEPQTLPSGSSKDDMKTYKALVAGGLGVIGRQLTQHLRSIPGWDVISLSRRTPEDATPDAHISVNLLDPSEVTAKLSTLEDITHVFHAAYQEQTTAQALIDVNLGMLRNLIAAVRTTRPSSLVSSFMRARSITAPI